MGAVADADRGAVPHRSDTISAEAVRGGGCDAERRVAEEQDLRETHGDVRADHPAHQCADDGGSRRDRDQDRYDDSSGHHDGSASGKKAFIATTAPQTTCSVYYKDCAQASKAGAAPITLGQPGYRTGLDPNGNGVACEPK